MTSNRTSRVGRSSRGQFSGGDAARGTTTSCTRPPHHPARPRPHTHQPVHEHRTGIQVHNDESAGRGFPRSWFGRGAGGSSGTFAH